MSVPDAKAWKITAEDWELRSDRWVHSNEEHIEAIALAVARRRAVAELRALVPVVCEPCEELESRYLCSCGCNRFRHADGRNCEATDIIDRIAAIEAEEA